MMRLVCTPRGVAACLTILTVLSVPSTGSSRMSPLVNAAPRMPDACKVTGIGLPNLQQCTHKTGRLWFTVSNYGIFGSQGNYFLRDCLTGAPASSAEFPGGSNIEYLLQGSLWIGALVGSDNDTVVHVGTDGWRNIRHFFPDQGPSGEIIRRSSNPLSPYYSSQAKSDMDLIATYYDTLSSSIFNSGNPDPEDGRPYKPLGLKITQASYSWSAGFGQDWVLVDDEIHNRGNEPLRKVYLGLFLDPDVGHLATPNRSFDDLSGFLLGTLSEDGNPVCTDTLNVAYAYDNDGDPFGGSFGATSPMGAIGVRVVRVPGDIGKFKPSFNWWVMDSGGSLDWGPQKWPGRVNVAGGRGQPMGNAMKYNYLSNGEIDYDQVYSAIDQSATDLGFGTGWVPPIGSSVDAAHGSDTRFLLSYGPFNLDPGDSLPFTFGLMVADGVQRDPNNFAQNLGSTLGNYFDPVKIASYEKNLNLSGLITDSRWIAKVFDNPSQREPVICKYIVVFDDTLYHLSGVVGRGDGVPDFKGPAPPPAPSIEYKTRAGEVMVRWFGKSTETLVDPFTGVKDFEGYHVEMSNDGRSFTTVGYYDKVDWKPYIYDPNGGTFVPSPTPPLTYDEIQQLYAANWDRCKNKPDTVRHPIDPNKFNAPIEVFNYYRDLPAIDNSQCFPDTTKTAIRVRWIRANQVLGDTVMYFVPQGYNLGLEQIKLYPKVTDPKNDSAYWYQYTLSGLLPSLPLYMAVVPFSNGYLSPTEQIDPQEGTPFANAKLVYPFPSDSERVAQGSKISVYPNPYRIDNDYSYFERPSINQGVLASTQRINFLNLPPKCTIRIYTLDGDLVQQINHDKDPGAADAGLETWDLLTRNAQKVVAGLYLFTVESKEGRYVGKIVIIL